MGAPFLRRTLRSYGVDADDLEDVMHDILMGAYRRLGTFDASRLLRAALGLSDEDEVPGGEPVPFSAVLPYLSKLRARRAWDSVYRWLYGIAWRQLTHYRQRAFRRREIPSGLQSSAILGGVDQRPRLEEQRMEATERAEVIDLLLASLVPQRRVMLVMHDMLDIPVVEIARELQINENTAQNRLRLAREDFRAAVKRLAPEQRSALRLGDRPFATEAATRRRPAPPRRE
ncbi:RNA polymerase sigma factor [Sorangium sp. So ce394]|uniref:RNA polymerase sigma factor n=1 Tax=Sorangium sp. So ce394 TaxID=3133310 RepID=UPI003F5C1DC1